MNLHRVPSIKYALIFITVIYAVGLTGILVSAYRELFLGLTPYNLLISFALILLYEKQKLSLQWLSLLVSIYVFTWSVEYIGVSTGQVFGNYSYGNTLGLKLLDTPLIIGVNWLILLMGSSSVLNKSSWHPVIKVLASAGLMTSLDVLIEQVAVRTDMWSWDNNQIPLQNYIAWFVVAVIVQSIWLLASNKKVNPMAARIFWLQWIFFGILSAYLLIWE